MTFEERGYLVIERKWYRAMKNEKASANDPIAKEVYSIRKREYYRQLEALADLYAIEPLLKRILETR